MQKVLSFISGAILGGLFGASVALLLTPASGEELREQMQERAQVLQEEVRLAAAQRRAEMEARLAALRSSNPPLD